MATRAERPKPSPLRAGARRPGAGAGRIPRPGLRYTTRLPPSRQPPTPWRTGVLALEHREPGVVHADQLRAQRAPTDGPDRDGRRAASSRQQPGPQPGIRRDERHAHPDAAPQGRRRVHDEGGRHQRQGGDRSRAQDRHHRRESERTPGRGGARILRGRSTRHAYPVLQGQRSHHGELRPPGRGPGVRQRTCSRPRRGAEGRRRGGPTGPVAGRAGGGKRCRDAREDVSRSWSSGGEVTREEFFRLQMAIRVCLDSFMSQMMACSVHQALISASLAPPIQQVPPALMFPRASTRYGPTIRVTSFGVLIRRYRPIPPQALQSRTGMCRLQ